METQRTIETFTTDWLGITLSVSYEASWLGSVRPADRAIAHLQVESVNPERAPLPITDTGYRSHFRSPSERITAVRSPSYCYGSRMRRSPLNGASFRKSAGDANRQAVSCRCSSDPVHA